MTTVDQTYLVILGAAAVQASHNARILAEHGDTQLGRPWAPHPGLRIWNGNICQLGHQNPAAFLAQANAALPSNWFVDHASHEHVRLAHLTPPPGYDDNPNTHDWIHCAATADGAVPITIAVTQTRDQDDEPR